MSGSFHDRGKSHWLGAMAMLALMGAAAVSIPSNAHAGDLCRNVSFKIKNKNNEGFKIKLTKVKYFNDTNNKWQTENVKNLECAMNATCTTGGDNLRDSEGQDITKIRFVYKEYKDNFGWSGNIEGGDKIPDKPRCKKDIIYGPFTIFGKK